MILIRNNILPTALTNAINLEIDKINYESSFWIFPGENLQVCKLVREALAETSLISEDILNNAYIVIRCVKANSQTTTYAIHFDNYTNTWLLPLKIPQSNQDGRLCVWENARKHPKCTYTNLVSKLFYQNPITVSFIKKYLLYKFHHVDLKVGDCAHFNGFTSLHFNEPIQGERRSILIHFDKPFSASILTIAIEKLSQYIVKRL
jgi:hypothetical protein